MVTHIPRAAAISAKVLSVGFEFAEENEASDRCRFRLDGSSKFGLGQASDLTCVIKCVTTLPMVEMRMDSAMLRQPSPWRHHGNP